MIHWALTAAAVLTLLFAIRVLFASSKGGNAGREKLGFGFSVVAAGLWIYVLRHHLGELGPAIRLGAGPLLVMPAVSAIARPARAQIIRATGGVILAVLIAGPVVSDLWTDYGPDTRSKTVRQIEAQLEEARSLRSELTSRLATYNTLEANTKAELQAFGSDWKAVEGNPEALRKLELLAAVRLKVDEARGTLAKLDSRTKRLNEALESGQEGAAPEQTQPESELERIKRQLEQEGESADIGIVEQHMQAQKLRALFEETQGAD